MWNLNLEMALNKKNCFLSRIKTDLPLSSIWQDKRVFPLLGNWVPIPESGYHIQETMHHIKETGYPIRETGYPIQETRYPFRKTMVVEFVAIM